MMVLMIAKMTTAMITSKSARLQRVILTTGGGRYYGKRSDSTTTETAMIATTARENNNNNKKKNHEIYQNNGNDNLMTGWTVRKALGESIQRLEAKNVTEPECSAMHLMAFSLLLPWEEGIRDLTTIRISKSIDNNDDDDNTNTNYNYNYNNNVLLQDKLLTKEQATDFERMLLRREQYEPIQYIVGQWDFLDYTMAIRPPLLCPRPETEELVMKIVEEETTTTTESSPVHVPMPMRRILDVGCGTGVIGISLAKLLPDAMVEAIDIEPIAIVTSMENAQRVLLLNDHQTSRTSGGGGGGGSSGGDGIDNNYPHPDRYKATLSSADEYKPDDHRFDIVVSNPPYIPRKDMMELSDDVSHYENDQALCGGNDGMDVIRTIIHKLPHWCHNDAVCWMEVDPSHPKMIQDLLLEDDNKDDEENFVGVRFESSHKDIFGFDRFVKLRVLSLFNK